jgi:hypothetical protein
MEPPIFKQTNKYFIDIQKRYSFRNMRENLTQNLPYKREALDKS